MEHILPYQLFDTLNTVYKHITEKDKQMKNILILTVMSLILAGCCMYCGGRGGWRHMIDNPIVIGNE